jgi:hypothetical protein
MIVTSLAMTVFPLPMTQAAEEAAGQKEWYSVRFDCLDNLPNRNRSDILYFLMKNTGMTWHGVIQK